MSSLNAHTSDFVLDDDDDGEMRDVDTSLTTSSPPASAPPLPHLHIVPPPPPPSAMLNPSAGAYHPDFMFCGTCTQCQEPDDKVELQDDEKLETYDEDDINNLDADIVILKTKFHLRQSLHNPSHMLVIQSLVKQIPGVSKVMIQSQDSSVVVDHDASLSTESVLRTLESVGHSAVIQSPQVNPTAGGYTDQAMGSSVSPGSMESGEGQPMWVRSQFYVRGICCASEVPVIKKIVKPLVGVSKLQINITTKMVHVQHDASVISAQVIAGVLSREGFPSRVERDGKASAVSRQQAMHHGRSTLKVHGTLSDADVSKIQASLSHLAGVSRIGVNISESLIYVDHDVYTVTSAQCVQALQPEFLCDVQTAAEQTAGDSAALMLSSIAKSKYVESTIQVEGLDTKQIRTVEKAIAQNFIRSQVRAIYPNIISETVKVEHDPKQVSILDVCNTLASYGLSKVQVTVNGGDAGLYLPEHSSGPQVSYGDEPSLLKIHANVWLSGVFWVLSMVSYRPGYEWFKWFGLGSVLFGLPPICVKAFRTLRRFQFDANCMMVTAALGAVALGEYDEAASVAFLFAVSEFLEARATMKARKALSAIVNLRPDHANVVHPVSKEIIIVPADQVPLGSLISVKTGDKIAADGIVVDGSTAIDESSLTGEAKPSHKKVGDQVSGGTINIGASPLVIRTTTSVDDSAVARLIRLVEEAQSNRSPTEKMIDTFARSYTPSVMFMAILMCTIPWFWGPEVGRYWTLNGLIIVVIACPCALTISTPVTYAAGLAATAQRGIIVKGGAKLEAMGSVDRIVFDKTGTLTKGTFSVMHLEVVGTSKSREDMLQLLALMQERSSHPLSASLVEAAKKEGVNVPRHIAVTDHSILKGEGITAQVDGKPVYVGNERLFNRLAMLDKLSLNHQQLAKAWANTGGTVGFIGTFENGIIGMFCVKDTIREEAEAVIKGFKDAHIDVMMCTGDSNAAAHAVAREIGIPRGAVHSQLLPEDKLHFVGSLKRPQPKSFALCREKRYVLFCGDGVNDAPALAVADIGASMGEGAAMAMEMSDVTLMDSHLTKLSYTIKMGRRVLRTVKENICLSLLAKAGVVVATFMGKMTLLLAIAADVGIMLIVTLNGMKLLPSKVYDPMAFMEVTNLKRKKRRKKTAGTDDGDYEMTSPTSTEPVDTSFDAKDAKIV